MGHFSMEIYAPSGSNLSGNQQLEAKLCPNAGIVFANSWCRARIILASTVNTNGA